MASISDPLSFCPRLNSSTFLHWSCFLSITFNDFWSNRRPLKSIRWRPISCQKIHLIGQLGLKILDPRVHISQSWLHPSTHTKTLETLGARWHLRNSSFGTRQPTTEVSSRTVLISIVKRSVNHGLFLFIIILFSIYSTEEKFFLYSNGIWTQIVVVEGENAGRLTTTTISVTR